MRLVPGHSLAVFRFMFGLVIFVHAFIMIGTGVLDPRYIESPILFPFIGFEWLPRFSAEVVYILYAVIAVTGVFIAVGLFFRTSVAIFLVTFGYFFLLEEPYYQNHFYLMILFGILLFFSHAGRVFSLDARWFGSKTRLVPELDYTLLRAQMGLVYVFGGVAKMNSDWLRGEPLREWLGRRELEILALPMSYGGLLLDLFVFPMLLWRRTRYLAIGLLLIFHVTNHHLFSIGIFPWLAMAATLLFLDYDWPNRNKVKFEIVERRRLAAAFAVLWLALQIALPLRHWFYPGRVAWTLDGFYFSWMMKLNTRTGDGNFFVDTDQGRTIVIPEDYMTTWQSSAVRTNPNEMIKFARWLRRHFEENGRSVHRVSADLKLQLNDHPPRDYIKPGTDLSRVPYGVFVSNSWIADFP